ncbi:hypothetical protein TYRP_015425 [Tyrophagus putrescentiae]|nr:hypothetical protein TYRP_015425 [Tyrophagus putrescentiae]
MQTAKTNPIKLSCWTTAVRKTVRNAESLFDRQTKVFGIWALFHLAKSITSDRSPSAISYQHRLFHSE